MIENILILECINVKEGDCGECEKGSERRVASTWTLGYLEAGK
jgi:hypothetical protein